MSWTTIVEGMAGEHCTKTVESALEVDEEAGYEVTSHRESPTP